MRYFYSLFFIMVLPFVFLRLLWRSIRVPANRYRWLERVGVFNSTGIKQDGFWVHAVSVGEVVAAIPLITALQKKFPNTNITVTTTTATGSQRLRQSLGNSVTHVYMPYDLPWAINGFIKRTKARCLIIMETELWPNLLHVCKTKNIPIIVANGRLSDHSFESYMKIKSFTRKMLQNVSYVAAQSKMDADRFRQLGLDEAKLQISGNLKFEVNIPEVQLKAGAELKHKLKSRLVLVVASTHAGEEEQILGAYKAIKTQLPQCLLVLVPRHPDRFNEVMKIIEKHGLSYVRRSTGEVCAPDTSVLFGDTMGELNIFYAAADIAFVGGSLVPMGGHNLLEPAAFGVPTITGPHFFNFKEITDKLQTAQGLCVVNDVQQLTLKVIEWLELSDSARREIGARGLSVIDQNRGAINRIMSLVDKFVAA